MQQRRKIRLVVEHESLHLYEEIVERQNDLSSEDPVLDWYTTHGNGD